MGLPTEYIKETDGKRIARLLQYRLMISRSSEFEKAVVLCGPEAGEVGCLKHLLKMKSNNAFFVDWEEKDGLSEARRRWDGVNAYFGNVKDVLESEKGLALVNLDMMGHLNETRYRLVALSSHRIEDGGFFFYTFFRGREHGLRRQKLLEMPDDIEESRIVRTALELRRALGSRFEPVFSLRYQSNEDKKSIRHSTMAVLGFQKRSPGGHLPSWNEGYSVGIHRDSEDASLGKQWVFEAKKG